MLKKIKEHTVGLRPLDPQSFVMVNYSFFTGFYPCNKHLTLKGKNEIISIRFYYCKEK